MTAITKKPENPIAHLTPEDIEQIGIELDAIRQEVLDARGASDAAYIRKVIRTQRQLELGSRAVLLASVFPPAWLLGTVGLSVAKILENMEIGHNVLHGQWDWMRDPKIHSTTWEWDMATPAEQWKHSHNELHHTYTNVIGKDNDLGYGIIASTRSSRGTRSSCSSRSGTSSTRASSSTPSRPTTWSWAATCGSPRSAAAPSSRPPSRV